MNIINFLKPLCTDGNKPITFKDTDFKIPKSISFEIRLLFDVFIATHIYYGILLFFYPYIHDNFVFPNTLDTMQFMIMSFFATIIIGNVIKGHFFTKK